MKRAAASNHAQSSVGLHRAGNAHKRRRTRNAHKRAAATNGTVLPDAETDPGPASANPTQETELKRKNGGNPEDGLGLSELPIAYMINEIIRQALESTIPDDTGANDTRNFDYRKIGSDMIIKKIIEADLVTSDKFYGAYARSLGEGPQRWRTFFNDIFAGSSLRALVHTVPFHLCSSAPVHCAQTSSTYEIQSQVQAELEQFPTISLGTRLCRLTPCCCVYFSLYERDGTRCMTVSVNTMLLRFHARSMSD